MIYGSSINMVRKSSSSIDYSDIWSESFNFDHTLNAMRFNNILTEASSPEVLYEQLITLQEGFIKDIFNGLMNIIKKFKDWIVNTVKKIIGKFRDKAGKTVSQGSDTVVKKVQAKQQKKNTLAIEERPTEILKKFFEGKEDFHIMDVGFTLSCFNKNEIISTLKSNNLVEEIFGKYRATKSEEESESYRDEMFKYAGDFLKRFTDPKLHKFLSANTEEEAMAVMGMIQEDPKKFISSLGLHWVASDEEVNDSTVDEILNIIKTASNFNSVSKTYDEIGNAALAFGNYCETSVKKAYNEAVKRVHPDNGNSGKYANEDMAELAQLKEIFSNFSKIANDILGKGMALESLNLGNIQQVINVLK